MPLFSKMDIQVLHDCARPSTVPCVQPHTETPLTSAITNEDPQAETTTVKINAALRLFQHSEDQTQDSLGKIYLPLGDAHHRLWS